MLSVLPDDILWEYLGVPSLMLTCKDFFNLFIKKYKPSWVSKDQLVKSIMCIHAFSDLTFKVKGGKCNGIITINTGTRVLKINIGHSLLEHFNHRKPFRKMAKVILRADYRVMSQSFLQELVNRKGIMNTSMLCIYEGKVYNTWYLPKGVKKAQVKILDNIGHLKGPLIYDIEPSVLLKSNALSAKKLGSDSKDISYSNAKFELKRLKKHINIDPLETPLYIDDPMKPIRFLQDIENLVTMWVPNRKVVWWCKVFNGVRVALTSPLIRNEAQPVYRLFNVSKALEIEWDDLTYPLYFWDKD